MNILHVNKSRTVIGLTLVLISGTTLGLSNYTDLIMQKETHTPDSFSLQSNAYLDDSPCLKRSETLLVGTWKGETKNANQETSRWTNIRQADGSYTVIFHTKHGDSTEKGYWAYTGCLYSTTTTLVDGRPGIFFESYRVHELSDTFFSYTSYRTGTTYQMTKVD